MPGGRSKTDGVAPKNGESEDSSLAAASERALILEIGRRVRAARQAAGLTQQRLAEAIGNRQGYVTALESGGGNPTVQTLFRIALALGISVGSLFPEDSATPPSQADIARLVETMARLEPLLREDERRGKVTVEVLTEIKRIQGSLAG